MGRIAIEYYHNILVEGPGSSNAIQSIFSTSKEITNYHYRRGGGRLIFRIGSMDKKSSTSGLFLRIINSVIRVIHSINDGRPAKSRRGNTADDAPLSIPASPSQLTLPLAILFWPGCG